MLRALTTFLGLHFLSRVLGLVLLAAGFAQGVYDGARSIANNQLRITSIEALLSRLSGDPAAGLQTSVESAAPWLWQAILLPLTVAPAAPIALAIGTLLLWLGQPGREPIGFLTRP